MNTAIVTSRQSLLDVAVQHCGTFEAAFRLAELNDVSLTDDLSNGDMLTLSAPDDRAAVQTFAVNRHKPATAFTQEELMVMLGQGEGIEFWGIEFDFIVQ